MMYKMCTPTSIFLMILIRKHNIFYFFSWLLIWRDCSIFYEWAILKYQTVCRIYYLYIRYFFASYLCWFFLYATAGEIFTLYTAYSYWIRALKSLYWENEASIFYHTYILSSHKLSGICGFTYIVGVENKAYIIREPLKTAILELFVDFN